MSSHVRTPPDPIEQLAFAFYGRVSTEDQQDPQASYDWQITRARQLIEPRGGVIVAGYFDIGLSRALPWQRRPQASRLLAGAARLRPRLPSSGDR
jgi:site-specific DNA recombinase